MNKDQEANAGKKEKEKEKDQEANGDKKAEDSSEKEEGEEEPEEELDEDTKREDRVARAGLEAIMREYALELAKEPKAAESGKGWTQTSLLLLLASMLLF